MKLNSQQQQAVEHVHGPLLVIAGAGSGKTRVITRKIGYLIEQCRLRPDRILAVTFTNKAAKEMQSRIGSHIKRRQKQKPVICTFHMLGLRMLKTKPLWAQLKPGFTIYDQQDAALLINDLVRKYGNLQSQSGEQLAAHVSHLKSQLMEPKDCITTAQTDYEYSLASLFLDYQKALNTINCVDLDDLIYRPALLMRQHEDFLNYWQNRVGYMLVDEYQDTNVAQYHMLRSLTGEHERFTVVGDDDQSIYSWRGANPDNLNTLASDYPRLTVIKLEQNYRSTQNILRAANSLINRNSHIFEKKLWSSLDNGETIRVIQAADQNDEAEKVIRALHAHQIITGEPLHHYAVLYRSNYQAKPFESALREYGIPYYLSGGTSFFDRSEIKDIFAYLRLMTNAGDDNAFLRIINTPRREIGVSTLDKLRGYALERQQPLYHCCMEMGFQQLINSGVQEKFRRFSAMIEELKRVAGDDPKAALTQLIEDIQYEAWIFGTVKDEKQAAKRFQNVQELISWMQKMHDKNPQSLADLVQKMVLLNILEKDDDGKSGCVQLLTLHAAKGLEYPHVYMVGMEENILPHHASLAEQLEEERRLCYVGMTRAQRTLTFSLTHKRKRYGETILCEPSRFLEEVDPDLIQWKADAAESEKVKQDHLAAMRRILARD